MSRNKKITVIISIIMIVILIVCAVICIVIKIEDDKLRLESEKLSTLVVKTKSGNEIVTDYKSFNNSNFFVKIPNEFVSLTSDEINQKYTGDVPDFVFANEDNNINIVISLTENNMANNQIIAYKKYIENTFANNFEILSTDYYQVDNYNVGKIEIMSNLDESNVYNNMMYFSYNDKLVIVTFNCSADIKDEWQSVGKFVLDSLFFNE